MYESGILVALLLWLFHAVWMPVMLNSRMARNLQKIGMRLSWTTLQARPAAGVIHARPWWWTVGKYILIVGGSLPLILLSWLYVAAWVGGLLYQRMKAAGQPVVMREFQWKLRNLEMGFDQLAKELYNLNTAMGLEQPEFERFRDDLWQLASARPS